MESGPVAAPPQPHQMVEEAGAGARSCPPEGAKAIFRSHGLDGRPGRPPGRRGRQNEAPLRFLQGDKATLHPVSSADRTRGAVKVFGA